jgi:hypothetical protein
MIYPMHTTIAGDDELGLLGVAHLKRLWSRYLAHRLAAAPPENNGEWAADNTVLSGLGLNLHEAMRYLYANGPSFEQFEEWILDRNGGSIEPARVERINAALKGNSAAPGNWACPGDAVLTSEDLASWEEKGYLVVHDAVPAEGCAAAVQAICEFLRMNLNDPSTWYNGPQGHSIWVPLLRHPAIEANRNSPRIRGAFEQIWKRSDLWMTVDQCGMNPPERPGWRFPGPNLHWDVSLTRPIPFGVQGLVYLTDTVEEQGAFTCVLGFHRTIENWLDSLPEGVNPRELDLNALGPVPIPGRTGDLIIWHQALPHGSRPNRATHPRFVQYLTMRPPDFETNPVWK